MDKVKKIKSGFKPFGTDLNKDKTLEHHQMSLIADMLTLEDIKNVSKWYSSIKITIQDLEN